MKVASASIVIALISAVVEAGEERKFTTIQPDLTEIRKAQATAQPYEFKEEYVPGKAFDRFYNIWLENTDYDKAAGEPHMKDLRKKGITLTNYWALTHPSQPNYLASVAGDYFGLDHDEFVRMPDNVTTLANLLDAKNISWGEYQEHSPYPGFEGFNFSNQESYANDYVRKHNPLVLMDAINTDESQLSKIKNFTDFEHDLKEKKLPQWSFITPNMTNDGHDTTIKVAGTWSKNFLEPLLENKYFTEKTLVVLTFDENETYEEPNRVLAILLGDIPEDLKGTEDDTYYDHYSLISTVQENWDLPKLGRNDCGANVFKLVADKTGFENIKIDMDGVYNNKSVEGWFSNKHIPLPPPDYSNCKAN
jgi:acid phosphatase